MCSRRERRGRGGGGGGGGGGEGEGGREGGKQLCSHINYKCARLITTTVKVRVGAFSVGIPLELGLESHLVSYFSGFLDSMPKRVGDHTHKHHQGSLYT